MASMQSSNNKRFIKTIIISGFGAVIGYAISFFITPYITENLGIEAYSFVNIANSAVGYAGIITIALTSFVVRYISISFHEEKIDEARSYYSSSIAACLVLSLIVFGIATVVIWQLEKLLNIPVDLIPSVKLLFIIVFINFVVTTVTTTYGTAAYIKNRLDITGIIKLSAKIVEAVVVFLLLVLLKPNVWYVATGTLVASLIVLCSSRIMTKKLTPELKFNIKLISVRKIKELIKNGIWNSLNQLGNVLNSGLDLIISNLMLSGVETGQISVGKTVGLIFSTLIQIVSQPFEPLLLKSYASCGTDLFLKEMSKAMRICGFVGAVSFAGFVALGDAFFKLWLPSQDYYILHILTILTVFNNITESILRPVYYISTLTVKNKIPCWITIAGGFLNVLTMYVLLKYTNLGVYAVVITTAVIMVAINLAFNPIYASHCIKIKSRFFYGIILRHLFATTVMVLVFWGMKIIVEPTSWLILFFEATLMLIVGGVLYILLMCDRNERVKLINSIKHKTHQ